MDEEIEEYVSDVMEKDVVTIDYNSSVEEAAKLMAKEGIAAVVIVREGTAIGIITERDIVSRVVAEELDPRKVIVRDIMSTPLITIKPDAKLKDAAKMMSEYGIRRLVVVDDNESLVGIITTADIARALAAKKSFTDVTLNAIARLKTTPTGGPYQ